MLIHLDGEKMLVCISKKGSSEIKRKRIKLITNIYVVFWRERKSGNGDKKINHFFKETITYIFTET